MELKKIATNSVNVRLETTDELYVSASCQYNGGVLSDVNEGDVRTLPTDEKPDGESIATFTGYGETCYIAFRTNDKDTRAAVTEIVTDFINGARELTFTTKINE